MNKIIKLVVIILALGMLLYPVLGEMNSGNVNGNSKDANRMDSGKSYGSTNDNSRDSNKMDSSGRSGNSDDSMREKVKEMYDNRSRIRDKEGMRGMGFAESEDNNYGNYVTFSVNNSTGEITNFGILGNAIFNSIKIAGFDFKSSTTHGAQTKIVNKNDSIVIKMHDNPAAVIEISSKTTSTLTYYLASGANASKQDSTIEIKSGNITSYIVSEKATSIDIAGSQVNISTGKGGIVFMASPVNMPHDNDMEKRFMEEVKKKRAGAEVSVGESDKYSVINYSENVNVTMQTIETDRMRMLIDSSDPSGKFILMNIDNSSLTLNEGKINLYLDNKSIKEVLTEQELYNSSESSFWLNKTGENRIEALVFISKFSTHQLDIVVGTQAVQTANQTATTTATRTTTTASTAVQTSAPKTSGFEIILGTISIIASLCAYRRKH